MTVFDDIRILRSLSDTALPPGAATEGTGELLETLDRLIDAISSGMGVEDDLKPEAAVQEAKEEEVAVLETVAPAVAEESPLTWSDAQELLYEDILWLFKIGDNEGAISSLGRLIDLGSNSKELLSFLELNQKRLVNIFNELVGDNDSEVVLMSNEYNGRFFMNEDWVRQVCSALSASTTIGALVDEIGESHRFHILTTLHRLQKEDLVAVS